MVTIRVKGRLREELRKRIRPTHEDMVEREVRAKAKLFSEKQKVQEQLEERQEELDHELKIQALREMEKEARRLRFQRSKAGKALAALRSAQRGLGEFQKKTEEFKRRKNMTERRIKKVAEERVGLDELRMWAKGEDNRYFGKYAPRYGSGAYGGKWNSNKSKSKSKRKKRNDNPYFKKGLW